MESKLNLAVKIKKCEAAYIGCFTQKYDNDIVVRYRDSKLVDMYNHNFTYVKKFLSIDNMKQMIKSELDNNISEKKDFIRLTMDEKPDAKCIEEYNGKLLIEHYGMYSYTPMKSPEWNALNEYQVEMIDDFFKVEDLVFLDVTYDSENCGEDFCNRRARRRGDVYLSEEPLSSYICYYNKMPVGKCDLFLHEGIAKIEDFVVLPSYQRRGVGTTILKYIMDQALSSGADVIYLVADEDDTPKEMYLKLGFEKAGDSYAIFGNLS